MPAWARMSGLGFRQAAVSSKGSGAGPLKVALPAAARSRMFAERSRNPLNKKPSEHWGGLIIGCRGWI